MRNSIDKTVDDVPVVQGVKQIIDLVLSKPEFKWAALLDTAFDYGQEEARPDFGSVINCYAFPELQALSLVAPYLVALEPGSGLRNQISRLIRHCQGRPMLSFVGTTGGIEDIRERWRAMHMVSVVDEHKMLLRFSDTRVLSYLPQVLTSSQWAAICGAVSIWVYFDRSGILVTYHIPNLKSLPEKVLIAKEQLERLLEVSRPDAEMALIAESMRDIIPIDSVVSARYRMIKDACELARSHKVNNNADVLALGVAAYLTEGRSNIDQRLHSLLQQRAWAAGSLGDAIVNAEII